jgi:release factor glutamine methyltransferase
VSSHAPFHLILANPPYIESAAISALARDVREHDPHLALDGGPDGLAPYRIIATGARTHLFPGGALMLEIGAGQGATVADILAAAGFSDIAVLKDLAGLDRVVVAHHL